jgi:hypothetical protein
MMNSGSARSGNSVYDAQSREGLASMPPPVPPFPLGIVSTGRNGGTAGPSPLSAVPICAASHTEESPVHQPNQTSQMAANHTMAQLIIWTHHASIPRPASPFASVPRLTDCPPHLALVDLIQILQWFPHRTLVMLLMLNCWRSHPQLVRTGGR